MVAQAVGIRAVLGLGGGGMAKVVEDKEDMLGLGLALERLQGVGVAR